MELEVFEALRAAIAPDDKARAAVGSVNRPIVSRYGLHAGQLATRANLAFLRGELRVDRQRTGGEVLTIVAEGKTDVLRRCVASILASAGMSAAIAGLSAH